MTTHEKLDSILSGYLQKHVRVLKNDPDYKRMTFDFIVKTLCPETEDWEKTYLRDTLVYDGYLTPSKYGDGDTFDLTPKGIVFKIEEGYVARHKSALTDKQLKEQALRKHSLDKLAIGISIFAIIIPTVISVYSLVVSRTSATTQEVQLLKSEVDSAAVQLQKQQMIIDSLLPLLHNTSTKPK